MSIKHFGYVVKDINKAKYLFEELGYSVFYKEIEDYDHSGTFVIKMCCANDYDIELIEDSDFSEKVYGGATSHICVSDKIDGEIICQYKDNVTMKKLNGIVFEESL